MVGKLRFFFPYRFVYVVGIESMILSFIDILFGE